MIHALAKQNSISVIGNAPADFSDQLDTAHPAGFSIR